MIKTFTIYLLILVSVNSLSASPSWTRDIQIDSGQLKAVNFQLFRTNQTTDIAYANQTKSKSNHFNYTNFTGVPRLIMAMKSYGVVPPTIITTLSIGFKFNITSVNRTNFTYTVSASGAALVALHYQYFAVVGYTNVFYMAFYSFPITSASKITNTSELSPRIDYATFTNPGGFVTNSNISSSQLVLQVWPYYFTYTPTGSAVSFNVSSVISSTTSFTVGITADNGCSITQMVITVLYFNKTQVYLQSYSQYIDKSLYVITGSDQTNIVTTTTMGNFSLMYQFRNSQEGIQGIYLPFSANGSTHFYFAATSSNTSKLYYVAIQSKTRVCSGSTPVFLVDDQLCHDKCPTPYYGYNSTYGYCKKCHYSCLNCSTPDNITTCTLCNATSFRVLSGNTCLCNLTYFDNGTQQCVPCYYTCLTCSSTSSSACLSCDGSGLHRNLSISTCICSNGYYENTTCFPCLNNCTQCAYVSMNQTVQCTACNSSLFMEVDPAQTTCICQDGYYNNSNVCLSCIKGCLLCTNGLTCDTCNTAGNWQKNISDSTCKCVNHFYIQTINTSSTCAACDSTCLTCSSNLITACLSCDSSINRNLTTTTCSCFYGYYDNITCFSCLNNCVECSFIQNNQTYNCLACNSSLSLTLDVNNSSCICSNGYYNNSGTCTKCMDGCLLCSSGNSCNSCDTANNWQTNITDNTCKCKDKFYVANVNGSSTCASCHYTCLTCSGGLNTQCLTCDSAILRNLTLSSCACLTGYFDNTTCFTCINSCIDCSYNQNNNTYLCKSCNSTLFQQVDLTQTSCTCFSGYFNNSGNCQACIIGCLTCSGAITCDLCNSTGNWQQNISNTTCKCISQYYLANNICNACPLGCLSCYLNSTVQCDQCNTTAHFNLSNNLCVCQTGYQLNSSACLIITVAVSCGNGIVEAGQECDDGNLDNFDGCSSICQVEANHFCLNNITTSSICYYDRPISLLTQQIFKVPLQNRVIVTLKIQAPNCNVAFLKFYLEKSTSIILITKTRLLASSDIVSQSVNYDSTTQLASVDFQYNQNIDLTKKQIQFVSSQNYAQDTTKYFYDSPSSVITLSAPDNLLLTTYSSQEDIRIIKTMSYAFAALIALMWFFWFIGLCYNQTATVVEFMLVVQIAYESLIQRKFITDGWIGLVLYGKYSYGYNYDYPTQVIYDRLRILSLNTYLFHNLNVTTVLIVFIVFAILVIFCYETVKITRQEQVIGDLTSTDAKIDLKTIRPQEIQQQKQYKIKKGIALVLFQAGTSLSLLTVKIVVINLMLISMKVFIDVIIVVSLLGVSYFLIWYFYYRCFDMEFTNDFSYKRMLRDSQKGSKKKSFSVKLGNIFVKYFYLTIFMLLVVFGIATGAPSFGLSFYICIIAISCIVLGLMVYYGLYFRKMHLVRSACNIAGLVGVMVLHMLQSFSIDNPQQSKTGPIVCLCILYLTFTLNFGMVGYIQFRRYRNKKLRYGNGKVAPLDKIQHNETLQPQLPQQPKIQIDFIQVRQQENLRKSNNSNQSLAQENKFQSIKSKSNQHSVASTHKKIAVPRHQIQFYQETNDKKLPKEENVVGIRQKMEKIAKNKDEIFQERPQVERIQIMDVSKSFSDLAKTKTKIKNDGKAKEPNESQTNKKAIEFIDIQQ